MGIGRDNGVGTEGDNRAGIREDDRTNTGEDNKVGIERDNKPGIRGSDDKPSTKGLDDKPGIERQDNKRAAELVVRVFRTRAQRLLYRVFLLATCSDTFLIFSSLESVIDLTLPSGSSIVNSGLSVTSTNDDAPSSR